jgi:hypothetical protein
VKDRIGGALEIGHGLLARQTDSAGKSGRLSLQGVRCRRDEKEAPLQTKEGQEVARSADSKRLRSAGNPAMQSQGNFFAA